MLFICTEGPCISVYGWFVKDDIVDQYLNKFESFSRNPFDGSILSPTVKRDITIQELLRITSEGKYIAKTRMCFLSRYHIKDLGRIPLWSNSHKKIKELYKNAKYEDHDFKLS